jgi:hypothetical protein
MPSDHPVTASRAPANDHLGRMSSIVVSLEVGPPRKGPDIAFWINTMEDSTLQTLVMELAGCCGAAVVDNRSASRIDCGYGGDSTSSVDERP